MGAQRRHPSLLARWWKREESGPTGLPASVVVLWQSRSWCQELGELSRRGLRGDWLVVEGRGQSGAECRKSRCRVAVTVRWAVVVQERAAPLAVWPPQPCRLWRG